MALSSCNAAPPTPTNSPLPLPTLYRALRATYPTAGLDTEVLSLGAIDPVLPPIEAGQSASPPPDRRYAVRAVVRTEHLVLASAMAQGTTLEAAEDRACRRVLELLGLAQGLGQGTEQGVELRSTQQGTEPGDPATGQAARGHDAIGHAATGHDAIGIDTSQAAIGHNAIGHAATGQAAIGIDTNQTAIGHNAIGHAATGQAAIGIDTSQAAIGHNAIGHAATGQAAIGHVATGHAAIGHDAIGIDTSQAALGHDEIGIDTNQTAIGIDTSHTATDQAENSITQDSSLNLDLGTGLEEHLAQNIVPISLNSPNISKELEQSEADRPSHNGHLALTPDPTDPHPGENLQHNSSAQPTAKPATLKPTTANGAILSLVPPLESPPAPSPLDTTPNPAPLVEDWGESLAQLDVEVRRLGWTPQQEADYLQAHYGHPSRDYVTEYSELLDLIQALKAIPKPPLTPVAPPAAVSPSPSATAPTATSTASPSPLPNSLESWEIPPLEAAPAGTAAIAPPAPAPIDPAAYTSSSLWESAPTPPASVPPGSAAPASAAPATIPPAIALLSRTEMMDQVLVECDRLGWTPQQGKDYLRQTYGKGARNQLTNDELREFLVYLGHLP